ncbi:nicotinamide riboside transporter PnuC [Mesoplasma lactucae]|uniref:Uncharacterized protein n=1 Tax=Mesoplasma lactucae ATCC 49193 TaxID=81460 RepID=A0A291IQM1_9MOLU|nr:nicotinamide riboside transporter PnuC [Mesoplasma lactucae]ATG97225.1 hypothetical protein CP520_00400 [Mesoplasma lactucae ATCC 49193]ATZ20333.1 nicotinamide mononucleotide transporter PnuC [Mesoplasma lactucae ATCC 49193]MCL8216504.1 hypothetical protein [Mesoplasma lactucae ATCC 49193]
MTKTQTKSVKNSDDNQNGNSQVFKTKMKNFLGVRTIGSDLKSLPKGFKYFIAIAIVVIIVFNFVSVTNNEGTVFLPLQKYRGVLDGNTPSLFGDSKSAATAVAILYSFNGVAAFSGVLMVALINFNKASQYFWQMVNALFFGMFALSVGFVGDLLMNAILLLFAPVGWYLFEVAGFGNRKQDAKGWKFNLAFYSILILLAFIVIMFWYWALPGATKDLFPKGEGWYTNWPDGNHKGKTIQILDGMTNGLNTVGFGMQMANLNQQFYVWFCVNILKILQFSGLAGKSTLNVNMLIEFGVWFALSLTGLWNRNLKKVIMPLFDKKTK